jgi:hypothetical protein
MNLRTYCALTLVVAFALVSAAAIASPQQKGIVSSAPSFDPTKSLSRAFPDSISLKQSGRLLEFCPDGTCDGFVVSNGVTTPELKDFAFLYEYFFPQFAYLDDWRPQSDPKETAREVLSKSEYQNCHNSNDLEAARCILRNLSSGGKIKLIFVRYDEGHRGVVSENIDQELSRDTPKK